MKISSSEIKYMATMSMLKNLMAQGLVTREEYDELDTIFANKYGSSLGILLFDSSLITP